MVRILAGTLIGVGRGLIDPEEIPAMLEAKDRQAAGMTVPPPGADTGEDRLSGWGNGKLKAVVCEDEEALRFFKKSRYVSA